MLERGFDWGTISGSLANDLTQTGTYGTGSFTRSLTGLTPGTEYYYRAKARNSAGWDYGSQMSFTAGTTVIDDQDELIAQLLEQINQISALIAQLQEQIAEIKGTSTSWCHAFNVNLRIGDSGAEVSALKTALIKNGVWPNEVVNDKFDEETASYIVAFQQKYKAEILTPWRLNYGTGFVGDTTRAKLNALYGCK